MAGNPRRLVVDTNVIVSGMISRTGMPARLLRAFRSNRAILVISDPVLREYLEVLEYPKLQKYLKSDRDIKQGLFSFLMMRSEHVVLRRVIHGSPDPDDDMFLSTAVNGRADLLVTGDKAGLLSLGAIEGIPIMSSRDAVELMGLDAL